MKATEFAQALTEGINTSTLDITEMLRSVPPSDTIVMSYGLYNGMLRHPAFKGYIENYLKDAVQPMIETTIPGRVMLMKTGHLIVVVA